MMQAWASSTTRCQAESAGQLVIGLTQETLLNCSIVGSKFPKTLSDRLHVCKGNFGQRSQRCTNIRKLAVGHSVTRRPGQKTPVN